MTVTVKIENPSRSTHALSLNLLKGLNLRALDHDSHVLEPGEKVELQIQLEDELSVMVRPSDLLRGSR